jgi:predicted DNA-binding WGR domain protein
MKQRYIYQDDKSHKFWEVEVKDKEIIICYGKIGADGQVTVKKFDSPSQAETAAEKAISEKIKKGYLNCTNQIEIKKNNNEKLLLTPTESSSLSRLIVFKKNDESFAIKEEYKNYSLLLDKDFSRNAKNNENELSLKKVNFFKNKYDLKNELIFENKISQKHKKLINNLFKTDDLENLCEEGWDKISKDFILNGDFSLTNIPVNNLTLLSSEIELIEKQISKKEFDLYLANGMPYDDYLDLEDNTLVCSPVFTEMTTLYENDVEIRSSNELLKKIYEKSKAHLEKQKNNKQNAKTSLMYGAKIERWVKRSWYKLTIYEEFDIDKLEITISRDYSISNAEFAYETFSLLYSGEDFEFDNNFGANTADYYLIKSNGEKFDLNILEEEEEEEEEEEDEDDEEE